MKIIAFLVTLFEYDKRFEVIGKDYIFYDYNFPLNLPEQLSKSYNLVIADPPFISEECLKKVASTILFLAKDKIVLCTGIFLFFHILFTTKYMFFVF